MIRDILRKWLGIADLNEDRKALELKVFDLQLRINVLEAHKLRSKEEPEIKKYSSWDGFKAAMNELGANNNGS